MVLTSTNVPLVNCAGHSATIINFHPTMFNIILISADSKWFFGEMKKFVLLTRFVRVVHQDAALLSGTIRSNLDPQVTKKGKMVI